MSDYRPGRVVEKRGEQVYLQCQNRHEFAVTLLHIFPMPPEGWAVKHCPFCASTELQEI